MGIVFMIRAVGGEVSWDNTVAPGATHGESDETITHQVCDRPTVSDKVLGRFYVQPQWIFDSINRRERRGEADFALGETLPPHLSPFVAERRIGDYVPPEQRVLEEGVKEGNKEEEKEDDVKKDDSSMGVKIGTMTKLDEDHDRKMIEDEEYKLRVMMIKKKHRGLYRDMMRNRKKRMNEAMNKERKRKAWDEKNGKKAKKKKVEEPAPAEVAA